MKIEPIYYNAVFAGMVIYVILMLSEDLLGISKRARMLLTIAAAVGYYYYADDIGRYIVAFFQKMGL